MTVNPELRLWVAARARRQCEYCLIHEKDSAFPHQVDHIISRKHGGTSTAENLAFACIYCNRYKGSDIAAFHRPSNRTVLLFNPRTQQWSDHFRLDGVIIQPLTPEGEVTIRILRLNENVLERQLLQQLGRYPSPSSGK